MKILLVSEFSMLSTGYAAYYKEIARTLTKAGHEVVELACYGDSNDTSHIRYQKKCPWKIIFNIPHKNDQIAQQMYAERNKRFGDSKYGGWIFDNICAQEHPDTIIAIRDFWYDKFIVESPAAKYMNVVLMGTVDSAPQKGEWLDVYGRCDYLTTYNEWSQDWLKTQYKCHNLTSFISPSADDAYRPLSKKDCRKFLGIPENIKIGGTVMRNQRRKRYPELFEAVKRVPDMYLYCHTAYPDKGWEIPNLILESGIHDRVFMTFMCNNCNKIEGKLFSTRSPTCSKCGRKMETCSSRKGATNDNLARIYNCFDIYLQPHNSEGFGIPVIEAAKCGVRSITTNYAAQIDVAKRTGAIPIEPLRLERELESNSLRALINIEEWADILNNPKTWVYDSKDIVDIYNKNYSWEMTGSKWLNLIDQIKPKNMWDTKPKIKEISSLEELESKNYSNSEFILACIITVANKSNLIGSFIHGELLDSLNSGMYFNPSEDGAFIAMDRKKIYNKFRSIIEYENKWEKAREGIRAGAMSLRNSK